MKQYILETFRFNDEMNKQMLKKIKELSDKEESIKYFSHLINSQIKWLARIKEFPADPKLDWWLPVYPEQELEERWNKSLQDWLDFLNSKSEDDLNKVTDFIGFDGTHFVCQLKDIALQLNYHSIHHRAQMQLIIRKQGIEPDFIDYIGTKFKRVID